MSSHNLKDTGLLKKKCMPAALTWNFIALSEKQTMMKDGSKFFVLQIAFKIFEQILGNTFK